MKTLLAIACLSISSLAVAAARPVEHVAQPTRAAVIKAASARLNGTSLKGAEVKFSAGQATVLTKQFAGGPIMQGKSSMKMEPIADVYFSGKQITNVQPVDRGIVPLAAK